MKSKNVYASFAAACQFLNIDENKLQLNYSNHDGNMYLWNE
jgi:hypothetical protein